MRVSDRDQSRCDVIFPGKDVCEAHCISCVWYLSCPSVKHSYYGVLLKSVIWECNSENRINFKYLREIFVSQKKHVFQNWC